MTISWVAGLATLPAAAYLFANLVEWASGTEGTSGVFGDAFQGWSAFSLTLLVAGGPLLAIGLIAAASLRVRNAVRAEDGVQATIDLRMSRSRVRLVVLSLLLFGGTVAYWFAQNWPCTYSNEWIC